MFSRDSRYYGQTAADAAAAQRGDAVRLIPPTPGEFTHTVREGDRLDLLAFRFYGDASRWWRIADANPEAEFPTDLLDERPHVAETFRLSADPFVTRFGQLLEDLGDALRALDSQARVVSLESLANASPAELDELKQHPALLHGARDFLQTTFVLLYPPSQVTRNKFFDAFRRNGFHVLRTESWPDGAQLAESFLLDDEKVKAELAGLTRELSETPGVVRLRASAVEATLEVTYNALVVERSTIAGKITGRGFRAESTTATRVGALIAIPGNRAG